MNTFGDLLFTHKYSSGPSLRETDKMVTKMGANFKFIHCADLHLGSRFPGISAKDPVLGKRLTESVFRSFEKIVDTAISENVDLMVISGDIFDEENETPSTRYRFAKELERLRIPCMISLGNHDHKRSWEESIPFPENAYVFPSEPTRKIIEIDGEKIELLGRSFPSRHTSENLAASLKGSVNMFTVAVVHCDLDSVSDDDYAPCKLSDLLGKNVDYWALGHIHKRSEVYSSPHIIYPGNIQGRNSKESGEKGAYLVTVSNNSVAKSRFIPTQDILWQDLVINIEGKDLFAVINEIRNKTKKGSILSLRMTGKGDIDAVLRLDPACFSDQVSAATGCIVSSLALQTFPSMDLVVLAHGNNLAANIIRAADRISVMERPELIDTICRTRASAEIRYVFENMSDEELTSLVTDAEMLILEKLSEGSR
jgi:DNA repair exonuclease